MIPVKDIVLSRACDKDQVERLLSVLRWYKGYLARGGHSAEIIDVLRVFDSIAAVEDIRNPIILRRADKGYELIRGSCRIATAIVKGFKHIVGLLMDEDPPDVVQRYREV
jgi:hypothetical protein